PVASTTELCGRRVPSVLPGPGLEGSQAFGVAHPDRAAPQRPARLVGAPRDGRIPSSLRAERANRVLEHRSPLREAHERGREGALRACTPLEAITLRRGRGSLERLRTQQVLLELRSDGRQLGFQLTHTGLG